MENETSGQLKRYWREAENYQKILYYTGFLLLVSAFFHAIVLIVTGGSLQGDVSFRKAISFGESFGLTAVSLAWFLTFLPKRRVLWWILSTIYAIATLVEVLLVTMQVWRGVPSHFNNSTPLDAAVFGAMGVSISLHAPLILAVLVGSLFFSKATPSFRWAISSAMVLLVASLIFGGIMIANNSNLIGTAGHVKIPHALSLHAMQVLPLLALLLSNTSFGEVLRTRLVVVGAMSYAALASVAAIQALRGLEMFDLGPVTSLVFFSSAAVSGITFLWALNGLWLKRAH